MAYVALDTDVASNLIKGRLPGKVTAQLAPYSPCITFVTLGELTEWIITRSWGRLSAATRLAGRPRPVNDMWNAACCLFEGLPLATLNVKDYQDFADHHGLVVLGAV